jgi:hypothetical protein
MWVLFLRTTSHLKWFEKYRGGQTDGNAKKLRNRICVGYIERIQFATLNVLLPFVYTL